MRVRYRFSILAVFAVASLRAQSTGVAFEVATIKPSPSEPRGKGIRIAGRRLIGTNQTVSDLILFAYSLHPQQITGMDAWVSNENFDVVAQPTGEKQPSTEEWKLMLRRLLQDRFDFAFHRDQRQLAVFALRIADGKPKLTRSADDPNGFPGFGARLGSIVARNASMRDFANLLQEGLMDRPVVDQTSLAGKFDFTLNWTPDDFQLAARGMKPSTSGGADTLPDFYEALREQLGLRLEPTKGLVDVIVIDRVRRPSPN